MTIPSAFERGQELTDAQLESFRGPMGGARMLTADEALTLLTAYDSMVAFKRSVRAALDGEPANDSYIGAIRSLKADRAEVREERDSAEATAAQHLERAESAERAVSVLTDSARALDKILVDAGVAAGRTHHQAARVLVQQRDAALADAAQLRRDFPPAPPLPTLGCQCRTCAILRRQQDER